MGVNPTVDYVYKFVAQLGEQSFPKRWTRVQFLPNLLFADEGSGFDSRSVHLRAARV